MTLQGGAVEAGQPPDDLGSCAWVRPFFSTFVAEWGCTDATLVVKIRLTRRA